MKDEYNVNRDLVRKDKKTIKECSNEEIYFALLDMTKKLAEDKVTEDGKKNVHEKYGRVPDR